MPNSNSEQPAFPIECNPGMTKREIIAKDAMVGILSSISGFDLTPSFVEHVAKGALIYADALLNALNNSTNEQP